MLLPAPLRPFRGAPLLLLCALVLLSACDEKRTAPRLKPLPPQALVLAFGDSLTYGSGARAEESYPAVLERMIDRRVLKEGVPGEVSAQGVNRLPGLLARYQPDLVIICHGGNDLLRFLDDAQTAKNLRQMIRLAREAGSQVILVGVPRPSLVLADGAGFYAQIAEELEVPYEATALAEILGRSETKTGLVHANAAGYQELARRVAELLQRSGAL